ncbi:MAG: DUF4424 family protein [Desulfomonilaceae bacterium]
MHKPRISIIVIWLLIVLTVFCTEAFANETTARLGAGGITFTKSEDIRMLEEILQISRKQVNVKYRFLNESDKDIHTTVAFPLPPYHLPPHDELDAREIMATFKVWVAGRPVSTEISRKAVVGDRDVTAQLRELGLSDDQIFDNADLTEDQQAALEKLDGGKGEFLGRTVTATAFWEQSFPAGKEIVIEHQYRPVVGFRFASAYHPGGLDMTDLLPRCLDARIGRTLGNRIIKAYAKLVEQDDDYVVRYDIEYILGTGRNWKGPIREFKLRIVKDKPDEFISLCFPGKPKKISPTVYEFYKRDFVPPGKLVVYFYQVGPMDPIESLEQTRK